MNQPDIRAHLFDIKQACGLIATFTEGRTFADYERDAMLRSAVERQLEIIGEALSQAVRIDPTLHDGIADSRKIIAFRNRLIHGYATVSNTVVWGIVEGSLAPLHRDVTGLLEQRGEHC